MNNQWISFAALMLFTVVTIGIGIWSARKTKSMDGFLLGGREIGAWMSAFAYGTSYFSAVIFIGYSGAFGWNVGVGALWIGVGNAILGCWLAWKVLGERTRVMTHTLDARTMPGFLSKRYGSKPMRVYTALMIFIFLLPYGASVYKGLGYLFGAVFPSVSNVFWGLPAATVCMIFVGLLTAVYLVLGGYLATALNDFIQGLIMLVGAVLMCVAVATCSEVGGLSAAFDKLHSIKPELTSVFGGSNWKLLITNILLTSVGAWGMPQMVHKFYAVKDGRAVKRASVIATVFALVVGCGAYFFGLFGRVIIPAGANGLPEGGLDNIVPNMLQIVFGSGVGGVLLLSLILLLVLSASMSTLAALVMTSASAITVDLHDALRGGDKPKHDGKTLLWTRVLCFAFVAVSVLFATFKFAIIVSIMSFSWGMLGGSFLGPYLWGLYGRFTTRAGAWAGLAGGALTVVTLTVVDTISYHTPDISWFHAFELASKNSPTFGVWALVVSVVAVPLVSLITKKPDAQAVDAMFAGLGRKGTKADDVAS